MGFRIHRGLWQFQKADGTYESRYRLNDQGALVTTDAEGNISGAFTTSVEWNSVTGKPTNLSSFTNDLGNYGSFFTTSGGTISGSYTIADASDNNRLYKGGSWINPKDPWGNYHIKAASGGMYIDASVYHIRPQDGSTDWLYINSSGASFSGTITSGGNMYAPRYYDSNDGNYFLDPAGTSYLNDVRVNILYDRNNTGYYLDPASTSNLNTVYTNTGYTTNVRGDYYYQQSHGNPRNNLGDPTVTEMALFNEQFNNKTAFYDPSKVTVWQQPNDGDEWQDITGNYSQDAIRRFIAGYDTSSNIFIPNGVYAFRIEVSAVSYVFLNALYIYWSSNSHSTKVHVWVRRVSNGEWLQHTSSSTAVSSWPGHLYLPFSTVPFLPGPHTSTGHRDIVRFEFIPNWSTGTYADRNIDLYKMQIWGGYPSGTRYPYTVNEYGDFTARRDVYASKFIDKDNTGYYLDPVNTSNLLDVTVRNITASGTIYGANFADYNDSNYYVNPATDARLRYLYVGDVAGSNDGSWNARMKVIGSSHARLDVVSNSDGIITTMYSHTGHGAGKVGTYSNHPLKFIINGSDKATLDSSGNLSLNGSLTATGYNPSNWDTAYGWGNHGSAGYATTSYVTTQINNLVDSAPGALNTLNELAAALGDDANFATNVTNSIATKLPLAGGTMTGQILIPSIGTGTYDGGIQLREQGYVGNTQSAWGYAPAITFHWGNRSAKRFGLRADGQFAVNDEPLALQSWVSSNYATASHTHNYLTAASGSEQQVDLRYAKWNQGGRTMNTDPRWNESGYDGDLGCLHIWAHTAAGASYGRAGIALYNGGAYQYLTTKGGATGLYVNNQEIIHSGNIGSQSVNYASSAGAVAWGNVSGKPTALSSFTNDLGNYGGWLTTSGKAADSNLLDGLDSTRFLYTTSGQFSGDWNTLTDGDQEIRLVEVHNITSGAHSNYPTGIYTYGSVLGWQLDNATFKMYASHTGDIAMQTGWNNDGYSGWMNVITSRNIGSQSVNYATSAGSLSSMNISQFTNNSGYITSNNATGANGNFYIDDNYGYGIVGAYSSTRYQGVFAMGDAYKLPADGSGTGTLYGIAWTHSNVGGESKAGLQHQALFMMNGRTYTAIGSGIWTDGTITTTSHGTSANWNTAYGWGNHSAQGYLKINTSDIQTQTAQIKIKSYSNAWAGGLALISQDGTKTFQLHPDNNGWMYTDNTWYFTSNIISNSGVKLGVGTTSPSYSIHAEGTIYGERAWASNLAGANKVKDSTNLGVARNIYEETTFVDGGKVLAFVSVGNGNSGNCYSWFSTENIPVDPNKDYEFSVWVKSDGSDHIYMGWHEYTAGSEIITSNPYFHTDKEDTAGGWMKITARLKGWQTSSPQAAEAQDRWVSQRSTQAAETHCNDGVMHSNTAFVHMRCGTCYGTVNGAKTYFYAPTITELDYHIHDERYYTESEVDTLLAGKQASGSYAAASHTHDDRYYTESESDARFATAAQGAKADTALQSLPAHNHDGVYLPIAGKAADANLLDGLDLHTGRNNEANKVVRTDGNGYIQAGWINTTSGNNGTTAIDRIYASHDGYIRYYTPANFRAQVTDGVYATAAQGAKADTALQSLPAHNHDGVYQPVGSYAASTHQHDASAIVSGQFAAERIGDLSGTYSIAGHSHSWSEITSKPTIPTNNNQLTNGAGYITGNGSTNGYAGQLSDRGGYGSNSFSFNQESGTFAGYSGWANYFIGNHGDGATYYNTTHIMPFWGAPKYSRLEGGAFRGPWTYWTEENFTPSAKADLAGSSSVTFSASDMNVHAWTRIHGGNGIYFQTYGYGLRSPDGEGVTYGNIATYGTGRNGWSGYSVANWISLMAIDSRRGLFLTDQDRWLIKYDSGDAFSDYEIQMGSDARNKSNVQNLTGSLDKVKALRGVSYNYKNQEKTSLGFIAQEVKQVIPEVVSADSEGYYAIGYQSLIAVLSEAIKEQQTIIDALTARIEALENNS